MARVSLAVIGSIAAFIVLAYVLFFLQTQFAMDTAERRGEVDKQEQVEADGSYRIAKYDKFHNLCQDIQAQNEQIANAEDMLSGSKRDDTVFALTQTKETMVGDYNSMASQDYTAGQFRDSDLPYRIDSSDMEIECG